MKKSAPFFLGIFTLLLLSHRPASAETTVNVTTSTSGGESNVSVNNSVSTSTTSTSTSNSTSHVRIETNGVVKEYTSNGNEDITLQSDDGSSKVTIKNTSSRILEKDNEGKSASVEGAMHVETIEKEMKEKVAAEKKKVTEKIQEQKKSVMRQILENFPFLGPFILRILTTPPNG